MKRWKRDEEGSICDNKTKRMNSDDDYQLKVWNDLQKNIVRNLNKLSEDNIQSVLNQLIKSNLLRGTGLLVKFVIKFQSCASDYTFMIALLVSVISHYVPEIGRLLVTRLTKNFLRGLKSEDKNMLQTSLSFISQLTNCGIINRISAFEICTLLLNEPTIDTINICCNFLLECGYKLKEDQREEFEIINNTLRKLLISKHVDKMTKMAINFFFENCKQFFNKTEESLSKHSEFLIRHEDDIIINFEYSNLDCKYHLDSFVKLSEVEFNDLEDQWDQIYNKFIEEKDEDSEQVVDDQNKIETTEIKAELTEKNALEISNKESNIITDLRKQIYLIIMSSVTYEEVVHKIMKRNIDKKYEYDIIKMIFDCCCKEKCFNKFYGMQAVRLSELETRYKSHIETLFEEIYNDIYSYESSNLRNAAEFYGFLLSSKVITWSCFNCVRLTEEDTHSASRIFIKYIFLYISSMKGEENLKEMMNKNYDTLVNKLFIIDNIDDARFCMNYFTALGLAKALPDQFIDNINFFYNEQVET